MRSFVDHDRPYVASAAPAAPGLVSATRGALCSDAYYVDTASGSLIGPSEAFSSLVEHWERWAACLGKHGLLVLEVSNLDIATTFRWVADSTGSPTARARAAVRQRQHQRLWSTARPAIHRHLKCPASPSRPCRYRAEATSMHFDCVQAHSGQLLVPATHFSLAAATAGLLPAEGSTLTYPKGASYTRIVLQQLLPRGVRIRLASAADLPQLISLEAHWGSADLAATEGMLRARLAAEPVGRATLVAEAVGGVHQAAAAHHGVEAIMAPITAPLLGAPITAPLLGALYTQRLTSAEALLATTREAELDLHAPEGRWLQLLGVVQRPDAPPLTECALRARGPQPAHAISAFLFARSRSRAATGFGSRVATIESRERRSGRSVGGALRDFACHLGRLDATVDGACGVTRCRGYVHGAGRSYAEHVTRGDDAGLRFHSTAGASIGELVPGYRPRDTSNLGHGVLVRYDLSKPIEAKAAAAAATQPLQVGAAIAAAATAAAAAAAAAADPAVTGVANGGAPLAAANGLSEADCCALVRQAVDGLRYGGVEPPSTHAMRLPSGAQRYGGGGAKVQGGGSQPQGRFGGRTALHWAARNGHLGVCEWLVAHGADVDATSSDGTPPLHWAVWQGRLEVCSWLVETAGAHLHALNTFGCNAFQWAAQSPSPRAVDVCRWLCASGLDVAVLNCNGHSALHKAAIKGNAKVCEWLLSADGGRLSERHLQADHDGNTPASMARAEGYETLARWLEAWQRQQEQQERQASST